MYAVILTPLYNHEPPEHQGTVMTEPEAEELKAKVLMKLDRIDNLSDSRYGAEVHIVPIGGNQ